MDVDNSKTVLVEPQNSNDFGGIKKEFEKIINNCGDVVLMGVWRGKVSEGMDFSDTAARCVIVIGIPNAPWGDPKVQAKISYLNHKYNTNQFVIAKSK